MSTENTNTPKPNQRGPKPYTPTGCPMHNAPTDVGEQGTVHTTAQGAEITDTDSSLKVGERGPILLQDHHFREKITHFDHERIPERAVHARGAGAHGVFKANGAAEKLTAASFLKKGVETDVFVRFSTVLGSRGSADTVRDTRGFATKFYTSEGTFDLVGNNIPVFFIQDAIKFPDIIHAGKPHPDREIPQAQSAHDTFWDFVTLHTEATAHTMWNMSDRGIPRSLRMMEGFGIHTFRLINDQGETSLVKFHWKPKLGVHSMTWEEAQLAGGMDPDFHRRDLADAIEAGNFPEWELGIQVFPDNEEQEFEGIDLLDPTKFVPEELAPVQIIGTMRLDGNPINYFAETEQVAFHPGHVVRGIDFTNDALLQGRLFSYLDTQLSRLGGPNFSQLPINRPHAPINDNFRDGMHQSAVHSNQPYNPNSISGGCPVIAGDDSAAKLIEVPQEIRDAHFTRQQAKSFDDHFSQATLFYRSLSEAEQLHTANAYAFELGKCYEKEIKQRGVDVLSHVDQQLAEYVAHKLGVQAPEPQQIEEQQPSPALRQTGKQWPVDGRVVGILTSADTDKNVAEQVRDALAQHKLTVFVVAETGGDGADRTYDTTRSIEFDGLYVIDQPDNTNARVLVEEAERHGKAVIAHDADVSVTTQNLVDELTQHRKWAH
ncbi:catalase [Corynebacterium ulceribovis]|uniref:catalase n=1 Tax=Corynebacterium ulceribovis TaxID=487732 RepID=UPI00036A6FA4|nr:catalase [Corynebacterium ulceribovis]